MSLSDPSFDPLSSSLLRIFRCVWLVGSLFLLGVVASRLIGSAPAAPQVPPAHVTAPHPNPGAPAE